SDGGLDQGFGDGGRVLTPFDQLDDARDLVVQPDGKLVAVGSTYTGGHVLFALARYLADGRLDDSFGNAGQVTTDLGATDQSAASLLLQPDGCLLVAGIYAPRGPSQAVLVRYLPD